MTTATATVDQDRISSPGCLLQKDDRIQTDCTSGDLKLKESRVYTDRMSGDRLLIGPGKRRKSRMIINGIFMEVEGKLVGYKRMLGNSVLALESVVTGKSKEEYEGPEGSIIIDLIAKHSLYGLPLPNKVQLTNYLNQYKKKLIPYLERDVKVSSEEIQNFEMNFPAAIDFLVEWLEKGLLRLYVSVGTYIRNLGGSLVFAYWKDGPENAPNVLYFAHGLKSVLFNDGYINPAAPAVDKSESDTSTSKETKKKKRRKNVKASLKRRERVLELQSPSRVLELQSPTHSDSSSQLPSSVAVPAMATPSGFTDFLDAVSEGDYVLLQSLGEVSYSKLKNDDGVTALHIAAAAGKTLVCRYLIEHLKFDINITDDNGETPLFPAIYGRHLPTVNLLLGNGADVNNVGAKGITPLHRAAEKGSLEIMKLLMSVMSEGADLKAEAQAGTPLHFAASGGNVDTLKFLLCDLKLDPNIIAPLGLTPLLMATSARSFECVELLLKAGANPNENCDQSQITPLCVAVSDQDVKLIRLLLMHGADPNQTDLTGKRALEYAALKGNCEVVELLFPITSAIACYPEWTICGIMQYEKSRKARNKRMYEMRKLIKWARAKAREAYKRENYFEAMRWYTHAVEVSDRTDAYKLSNRSLCWTVANEGKPAKICSSLGPPGWTMAAAMHDLKCCYEEASLALGLENASFDK